MVKRARETEKDRLSRAIIEYISTCRGVVCVCLYVCFDVCTQLRHVIKQSVKVVGARLRHCAEITSVSSSLAECVVYIHI